MALLIVATPVHAEIEISLYSGYQTAPPSHVTVRNDTFIPDDSFDLSWEGRPFEWPFYAGARATYWNTPSTGFGLDYAHNKTYPLNDNLPAGYRALEFTDGLNTWTINAYRRWESGLGELTPYIGAGVGLSVPGVEVTYEFSRTFEYQITGPAAVWIAGASLPVTEDWSVFGEYKGTYTSNTVRLEGGGTLQSDIYTNALNFGVSFSY